MKKPIVFMFSGQGSQYFQMGRELYENHSRFALWMDHCDDLVYPLIDESLIDILYDRNKSKSEPFDNIVHSNPALLSIEYSLARVIMESGVQPDYLLGYSLGEFTAAVVSGAISLEQGLELVVEFAKTLDKHEPPAGMLAVIDSSDIIKRESQMFKDVWLTGVNFDNNFVVGGLATTLDELESQLKQKGIMKQRLPVKYGFHTELIDPLKTAFLDLAADVDMGPIGIPTVSSLTCEQLQHVNADYFWDVVRTPVEFEKTILKMQQKQDCIFIDVGPSGTMATFVKYICPPSSNSEHHEVMNQYGKNLRSLVDLQTALKD